MKGVILALLAAASLVSCSGNGGTASTVPAASMASVLEIESVSTVKLTALVDSIGGTTQFVLYPTCVQHVPVTYSAQTKLAGRIAVGASVAVVGGMYDANNTGISKQTNICSSLDHITNPVSITVSGATPAPSASPTPLGSSPPGTVSDANYTQIVNGKPWPANFRPYCANPGPNPGSPCPWNDTLPDNPAQLYPNSAGIIQTMFASQPAILAGDSLPADDGGFPVYLAAASDPIVTLACTQYCGTRSAAIHIPAKALGSPSSDKTSASFSPTAPNGIAGSRPIPAAPRDRARRSTVRVSSEAGRTFPAGARATGTQAQRACCASTR